MRRSFVIERPCRIVEFVGLPISADGAVRRERPITDVHIVDARGRTVYVDEHRAGSSLAFRRARARRHLPVYNGVRGAMRWTRGFRAWRCVICGTVLAGRAPKGGAS